MSLVLQIETQLSRCDGNCEISKANYDVPYVQILLKVAYFKGLRHEDYLSNIPLKVL